MGENKTEDLRKAEYDKNFDEKYKDEEKVLTCTECYQVCLDNLTKPQ